MKSLLKKTGLAIALGATALVATAPAEAQRWGHYRGRGNGDAVIAGIAGLAVGAAIASSANPRRDVYYRDRGFRPDYDGYYYRRHGYYPAGGYYSYAYRDRYPVCHLERRWDGYWRRGVTVRVCG